MSGKDKRIPIGVTQNMLYMLFCKFADVFACFFTSQCQWLGSYGAGGSWVWPWCFMMLWICGERIEVISRCYLLDLFDDAKDAKRILRGTAGGFPHPSHINFSPLFYRTNSSKTIPNLVECAHSYIYIKTIRHCLKIYLWQLLMQNIPRH